MPIQYLPTFIAVFKSLASAPLTSPITIRSGRILKEFFTKSAKLIFSLLSKREHSFKEWVFNSRVSSITTKRSLGGINDNKAFNIVVFPAPGPPAIIMFPGLTDIPST